jgi:hypothetical protein
MSVREPRDEKPVTAMENPDKQKQATMSITTTITYDTSPTTIATILGGPILAQDDSGRIFHAGQKIASVLCELSAADSRVVVRVLPDATSTSPVIIDWVSVTVLVPVPLTQADAGGATWSVANGRGQDIEITAPALVGGEREYVFNSSPADPPVKLKVTVRRT